MFDDYGSALMLALAVAFVILLVAAILGAFFHHG